MFKTVYLAECSKTYRQWLPRLLKGFVRQVLDLWDCPEVPIECDSSENILIVDEAFLERGPAPAITAIAGLLEAQRIVAMPILVLRRRERRLGELSTHVMILRRPFYFRELEEWLERVRPKGRKSEEVRMSEDNYEKGNRVVDRPALDAEVLEKITREAIEKVVREMVPPMAEKIVREEIRRLTE